MKKSKILSAFLAAVMSVTIAQGTVFAEEANNTIVLSVEKFTVGQGYVLEPTEVSFSEGDTAADVIEKALGKENLNDGDGVGTYISSVANENTTYNIPSFIKDAVSTAGGTLSDAPAKEGLLAGMDFYSMSGWMFIVNNESSMSGVSEYAVKSGDVIRLSFSIIGYGSDIGLDTSSMAEWGGMASLIPETNRDEILTLLAENKASEDLDEYKAAISASSDLSSTQDKLDTAAAALSEAISPVDTTPEQTPAQTTPETTGEVTDDTTTPAETEPAATTDTEKKPNANTGVEGITVIGGIGIASILSIMGAKRRK